MDDDQPDPARALVTPTGEPVHQVRDAERICPRCGAPPGKRVASQGFGTPHPVCGVCGFDFTGEPWP
jgi:uncharacterized protein (DUF983 family)